MENDRLFGEIDSFLASQRQKSDQDRILDGGIMLALLCMRNVTTRNDRIELRQEDRDATRLMYYLVEPGLADDLAHLETRSDGRGPVQVVHLHWDRLCSYFGKDLREMDVLLKERFPKLVRRHRITLAYLLGD